VAVTQRHSGSERFAQRSRYIKIRRKILHLPKRFGAKDYVTMIHTMKKLLIPWFSLLIAVFLSSCASEPASTTTTTTTRETTLQQPTTTTQSTTTRY